MARVSLFRHTEHASHSMRVYYGVLLVACLVAFGALVAVNALQGKSLIWLSDGEALYYNFFVYEGEWLRSILASIGQGTCEIPQYSFDAGYGADILATMAGCWNDPFNLISVVVPPEYAEYAFEALVFVRFFLAAVAFSLYAFSKGNAKSVTLCGALCYVLCGYAVLWGVLRHPNFLNEALLFPLLLLGADKIFEKKSPVLFIGAMALQFFFSVYFSYMVLIVLVVYCAIKYGFSQRQKSVKDFVILVGTFIAFIMVAALIAGIALVPLVLMLTSMGRVGLSRDISTFDSLYFYMQYAGNMVGATFVKRGVVIGSVGVVGILAFVVSGRLLPRRTRMPWLIGLALGIIGSLTPLVGSALNGFSYSTDRWMFVFSFCVAYALVLVMPVLKRFSQRQWIAFGALCAVVLILTLACVLEVPHRCSVVSVLLFAVVVGIMVVGGRTVRTTTLSALLLVCLIAGTTTSVTFFSGTSGGRNGLGTYQAAGQAYAVAHTVPFAQVDTVFDEGYRIDRADVFGTRNQTLAQGFKGVDFYSSFYNQNVDDFRQSLGIADSFSNFRFNGHDSRFAPESIMGARYFVTDEANADRVPYGYEFKEDLGSSYDGTTYALYENTAALPLAFVYDVATSEDTYYDLSMIQRQELLTKACVLGDIAPDQKASVELSATTIQPVSLVAEKSAVCSDTSITTYKKRGKVVLNAEGAASSEVSVVMENISLVPLDPAERLRLQREAGENPTDGDVLKQLGWIPEDTSHITVESNDISRSFSLVNSRRTTYGGKTDWVVNMGYSGVPLTSYNVTLGTPGIYPFDGIYVACQDVEVISQNLKALQNNNTAMVSFGINGMNVHVDAEEGSDQAGRAQSGKNNADQRSDSDQGSASNKADNGHSGKGNPVQANDSRYVFLSVPYSSGWSATVDGQPASIQKANIGFMALVVDGNAHDIQLTYHTPGLALGAGCSVVGILLFAGIVLARRKVGKYYDSL